MRVPRRITWLVLSAACALTGDAMADVPVDSIGNPAKVVVEPARSTLVGQRATRQLIASATDPDGATRDLTRALNWTSLDPAVATVSARGQVVPRGNGKATIVARGGSVEATATVEVSGMDRVTPVSFRNDVVPSFSQAGCNMGACHGTPTGKGGFRLSLRGYLPDQDFNVVTREAAGRRINVLASESSILLLKPLGEVPPRGRSPVAPQLQVVPVPPRLDEGRRQG